MEQTPAVQKPKLDIAKDTTPIKCDKCKGESFQEGFLLRKVSPILTGTSQGGLIPIQVFVCVSCGGVNEEFTPKEIRSSIIT